MWVTPYEYLRFAGILAPQTFSQEGSTDVANFSSEPGAGSGEVFKSCPHIIPLEPILRHNQNPNFPTILYALIRNGLNNK
jgi:hypothetical protein